MQRRGLKNLDAAAADDDGSGCGDFLCQADLNHVFSRLRTENLCGAVSGRVLAVSRRDAPKPSPLAIAVVCELVFVVAVKSQFAAERFLGRPFADSERRYQGGAQTFVVPGYQALEPASH